MRATRDSAGRHALVLGSLLAFGALAGLGGDDADAHSVASVSLGDVTASNAGLTKEELTAVTHANLNQIRHCYEQLMQRFPLATGKTTLQATIPESGHSPKTTITNATIADAPFRACLVGKVSHWSFPKPRGGAEVAMDVTFFFQSESVSVTRTTPVRPASAEIVIDGRTSLDHVAKGQHFVEAVQGAEYEIRLSNPYDLRMAVAVAVDGLNSLDAKHTSAADAMKWIIPPHGAVTVRGWQVSKDRLRHFVFTSEAGSLGAKLGKTGDLGSIAVVGYLERSVVSPTMAASSAMKPARAREMSGPRDSKTSGLGGFGSTDGKGVSLSEIGLARPSNAAPTPALAATGQGRSVDGKISVIALDLEPQPVLKQTIRYEYHDALVRLGVLPDRDDALRRRAGAKGFSEPVGFVPDL